MTRADLCGFVKRKEQLEQGTRAKERMFERDMRITLQICVCVDVRSIDHRVNAMWNVKKNDYLGAFVMHRAPVFLGVRPGRDEPAPIARHGDADEIERAPARTVVVRVEGAVEGVVDVWGFGAVENETVGGNAGDDAASAVVFDVKDGVAEAAGSADDGHGAVSHGDHLRQAAGFKHGWDEEKVAPGVDEMRQRLVVLEHEAASTWVLFGHFLGERVELVLMRRVGRAAKEHKGCAALESSVTRVLDEMDTFLSGETRDDADDGHVFAILDAQSGA